MLAAVWNAAQKVRRERFFRHILSLGGGAGLGQLLVAASYPLITRLFTPADLGISGLVIGFSFLAANVVGGKYELAVVSAESTEEAQRLCVASMMLAIVLSVGACFVMCGLILGNVLSYGVVPLWGAMILWPTLLLTAWFTTLRFWLARESKFDEVGRALVRQGVGRAVFPLALAMTQSGVLALLAGELLGRALAVRRLAANFWKQLSPTLDRQFMTHVRVVMLEHWKCPCILLPSSLLDSLAAWLPLPVVTTMFGATAAGQFALVQRVVSLPAAFISASVSDVVHAHAASEHRDNPQGLWLAVRSTAKRLAVISALVYVPIGICSPWVFGYIFGSAWSQAGVLVSCLVPFLTVQCVVGPLTRVFIISGRYDFKLLCDLLNCSLPLILFAVLQRHGLEASVVGFSLGSLIVSVVALVLIRRACMDVVRRGTTERQVF